MKYLSSFFGVFAAAALIFSFNAQAQENANSDENGKVVRGAYETNGAFDNIYVGLGAGVNSALDFKKGIGGFGLATDVNVGKWWTPAIGARLGWHGISNQINNVKNTYNYFHGDLVWNLFNTIFGYQETRFWNMNPYATAGVLVVSTAANDLEYGAGAGLNNVFRVTERINLTLDLQALIGRAFAYDKTAGTRFLLLPSASLGLAFNLGKTNFDRHSSITPVVIPVPFTTEQYNALADKVAQLEKENAELKDKIAALEKELAPYRNLVNGQTYLFENGTFTALDAASIGGGSPLSVYFDCGSSKLSQRELAHLEYFTDNVVNADTKLAVNGYADKQTGSARRNQVLSEQRVKTVVDLLKKAGAQESNIETGAHGDKIQLFKGAEKNRVVTIELK